MKQVLFASAVLAGFLPLISLSFAENAKATATSLEQVACPGAGNISVRSGSLDQVLFYAKAGEPLKLFQGWGETQKTVAGTAYQKVQFSGRDDGANIGWIEASAIRAEADCPSVILPPVEISSTLDKTAAFRFPLKNRPTTSFTSGERAFGSVRDSGARRHAGNDLYQVENDPVVAVSKGRVLRNLYYFYQGTYALEVQHSNGMVVRYGEVTGRSAVKGGASVASGQTVGYMGKTSCCTPMLHFELYSGKGSGPLTTRVGSFQRRSDLVNPSGYLTQWEASTFGSRLE